MEDRRKKKQRFVLMQIRLDPEMKRQVIDAATIEAEGNVSLWLRRVLKEALDRTKES